MTVKVVRKGHEITGIHIAKNKVHSYFPERVPAVELELDHLQIQCELRPTFWADNPEIEDPRLNIWLTAKFPNRKPGRDSCRIVMSRTNGSSFRLQVAKSSVARGLTSAARKH